MSDPAPSTQERLCDNCHSAPGTERWAGDSDALTVARNPQWVKMWCRPCCAKAQLVYAEKLAANIPALRQELGIAPPASAGGAQDTTSAELIPPNPNRRGELVYGPPADPHPLTAQIEQEINELKQSPEYVRGAHVTHAFVRGMERALALLTPPVRQERP
jgi:hypothetical protein